MRKGKSGSDKVLAGAEEGAAEDSLTEDQVCSAIASAWNARAIQQGDDERTVKQMAKFWGMSERATMSRLNTLIEDGIVEMRNALVNGSYVNLYKLK